MPASSAVSLTSAHVPKIIGGVGARAEHGFWRKVHMTSITRSGGAGGRDLSHASDESSRGGNTTTSGRNIVKLASASVFGSGMHASTLGVTATMTTVLGFGDSIQLNSESRFIGNGRAFRQHINLGLDEGIELGPILSG
jgi:hypothetical protein